MPNDNLERKQTKPTVVPPQNDRQGKAFSGVKFEAHTGPLPHPDTLKGYYEISPTLGDAIATEFVKTGEHRRAVEKKNQELQEMQIKADIEQTRKAPYIALFAMLLILASGVIFLFAGSPSLGAGIITALTVAVVASLINNRVQSRREIEATIRLEMLQQQNNAENAKKEKPQSE